jgi:hypothetical protein
MFMPELAMPRLFPELQMQMACWVNLFILKDKELWKMLEQSSLFSLWCTGVQCENERTERPNKKTGADLSRIRSR